MPAGASWTGHWLPILANYSQFIGGVPLLAAIVGVYLSHQCHVRGCPRLSWHPHPEHGHPVCRRHLRRTHRPPG